MFRTSGILALLVVSFAPAQTLIEEVRANTQAINALNARLDRIEAKVDKLLPPPATPAPPTATAPAVWPVPRTFAEAWQQAVDRNLPLVIWSGNSLCPGCIRATTANGTFVSWVGWVPSLSPLSTTQDAIIVGLPDGGVVYHAATITQWGEQGHVKSILGALQAFRANRLAIRQDRVAARSAYSGGMMGYSSMSYSSGVRVMSRSGGGG